jgi:ubiquitin C-terminal hydrolase
MTGLGSEANERGLLIAEAPTSCVQCKAPLCLRKQVINLALGNTDDMLCLECLGKDSSQKAIDVLAGIQPYLLSRDCFAKQWQRYADDSFCPDPLGCFPAACFAANS